MNADFRNYAVKHLGMNGLALDQYIGKTSPVTSSYISPTIIEERQLNVAQMDVFSRLMMDRIIFLGTTVDDYSANVIQAVAFGHSVIAVDTHVFRVSHRLGLVPKSCDTTLKVERELMCNIPSEQAADAHHWLLLHGRYVCTSRAPHCEKCPFESFCPKNFEGSKLA